MHALTKTLAGVATIALLATGCSGMTSEPSASEQARSDRTRGVEDIRENQPVEAMRYSPTLATIQKWVTTWGQEGTVAYVYMKKQTGEVDGYFVMDGPPVSMCTSGSPTYDFENRDGISGDQDLVVPAPGLDGAYYGGCDADRYYGFDAVTGQYLEYTDGFITTAMLSNQPIPQMSDNPYVSSVDEVQAQ